MTNFDQASPSEILYENRSIFLLGEIDAACEFHAVQLLLALDALGKDPITLYIDSPGGVVSAGLAIYDTIQLVGAPVYTVCIGCAASMAALLLACGEPGHRVATENSSIMIHQGRSSVGGKLSDMQITLEYFGRTQDNLNRLLARHTGRPKDEIAELVKWDRWMTPSEAIEFGLIDEIVLPKKASLAE